MDLTRVLLLKIEADKRLDGTRWIRFDTPNEIGVDGYSMEEISYHLTMLIDGGFVKGREGTVANPTINKLTWQGHELLDDIRDDTIWGKTKERAKGLGSVGIALMWELAKAELKLKLHLP